jgi:hypothetical protein
MRERRHAQTSPEGRRGARRRRVRRRASALSLGIVWLGALVAGVPIPADAGVVYGRVYKDGQPQPRRTLQVAGKDIRFTSDEQGRYSILLAPGVHCVQSDGLEARIQSHPQPIAQDIALKKNGCAN